MEAAIDTNCGLPNRRSWSTKIFNACNKLARDGLLKDIGRRGYVLTAQGRSYLRWAATL